MKFKWLIVIAIMALTSFIIGCGGGSGGNKPTPTPSISVTLDANKVTMCLDSRFGQLPLNLIATVISSPDSVSQTVTWKSSDTSIATVTSSGSVVAKGIGNCIITATSTIDTSAYASCNIEVIDKPVTKVISKGTHVLKYNNKTINLKVTDSNNSNYLAVVEYPLLNMKKATSYDAGFIVNKNTGEIMFADLIKMSESRFDIENGGNCVAFNENIIINNEYESSGVLPWAATSLSIRFEDKEMFLLNKEYIPIYKFAYNWSYGTSKFNEIRWWAPTIGWFVKDDNSTLISYN